MASFPFNTLCPLAKGGIKGGVESRTLSSFPAKVLEVTRCGSVRYEILSLLWQWDVPNFCQNILSLRSKCPVYILLDSWSHLTCNINIQITGNGIFTIPDLLVIYRLVVLNGRYGGVFSQLLNLHYLQFGYLCKIGHATKPIPHLSLDDSLSHGAGTRHGLAIWGIIRLSKARAP